MGLAEVLSYGDSNEEEQVLSARFACFSVLKNCSDDFPQSINDQYYLAHISKEPAILDQLVRVRNNWVRNEVASNKHAQVSTLEYLARDENNIVRMSVARNPNTIISTVLSLVKDPDKNVAMYALRNPNLPEDVIHQLIVKHPNLPKNAFYKFLNPKYFQAIAINPNIPTDIAQVILKEGDLNTLGRLAENQGVDTSILEQLSQYSEFYVVTRVARNLHTAESLLEKLRQHKNQIIQSAAEETLKIIKDEHPCRGVDGEPRISKYLNAVSTSCLS